MASVPNQPWPDVGESGMKRTRAFAAALFVVIGLSVASAAQEKAVKKSDTKKTGDAETKYLILHGDDAGMCHGANVGTIEAMEKGVLSSASIMMPCPWILEIIDYAKKHPERDFGLHLTLTAEWRRYRWGSVAPCDKVSSLLDPQGYFWDDIPRVLLTAKADEAAMEVKAQIDLARRLGLNPTHADNHMGSLFVRPDIFEAYMNVATAEKLPPMMVNATEEMLAKRAPLLTKIGPVWRDRLVEMGYPVLDRLESTEGRPYEKRKENMVKMLRSIQPGLTEIILHCGTRSDEMRNICGSWEQRADDVLLCLDPDIKAEIERNNIVLTNWREQHKLAQERARKAKAQK